jgi:hypothetical protein
MTHDTDLGHADPGHADPVDLADEPTSTLALFEGDEGSLALTHRRALLALLKNRFISAKTHPKEWAAVTANQRLIRSRLNDLFLDLVISTDNEVAYKRQVTPEGGGRFPTLLHDVAWGREETILLVFLRSRYRSEKAAGADRVFADRADMHEYVEQQRPGSATDVAGDRRKTQRALEAVYRTGLLLGRSDADRFEISGAIEVLLPLRTLQGLLEWLAQQNNGGAASDDLDGGPGGRPVDGQATDAAPTGENESGEIR